MSDGKKYALIFTAIMLIALGVRIGFLIHDRHVAETESAKSKEPELKATDDQNVYLVSKHQSSLNDARDLNGQKLWIAAADQVVPFAATPARIDYHKPAPVLRGAEPIQVVNFIEQKADPKVATRIPEGDKQAVMLFHRASDPTHLLGAPVGAHQDGIWTFYLDNILFYEDPHKLFEHWGKQNWEAVDAHRVIPGMSERMVGTSVGAITSSASGLPGNRTATFINNGHPITVTFVHDKVTKVEGQ